MAGARDLANAIDKLIVEKPDDKRLPAAEDRPAISAAMGVGDEEAAAGIAFPLTELGRTLGAGQTLASPSGLLTLEYRNAVTITMSDANGASGPFNYADG